MKSYRSDVQRHLDAVVVEKVWSERVAKLLESASDVAWARRASKHHPTVCCGHAGISKQGDQHWLLLLISQTDLS